MAFMDENFLLDTATAVELYHSYAADCSIFDYHNHLSPMDIAQRRGFHNLTEIWLETDHYKWRAMRACGVEERYITGKDTDDYEKFLKWAQTVPRLVGSPLYHWTHLELQRYFGITDLLNPQTASGIWEKTCEMLMTPGFDTVSLLEKQRVKVLCTTDDPADGLEWHMAIRQDQTMPFQVLPSFRPDRFLSVEAVAFSGAVQALSERNKGRIQTLSDMKASLRVSMDRFLEAGWRVSDHGFSQFLYSGTGNGEAAFEKAMKGASLSNQEIADYRGDLLRFLAEEYYRRGIVMQLHMGPIRNVSPGLYATIGADAGGDSVGLTINPFELAAFLGDMDRRGTLPRTILYNLNPADNIVLSTMAVTFAPKVQYGAAWWFNDTLRGMENQLEELMETGQLAENVGMLTDSRSFTSFPRHEYFRRILCRKLGHLVADGLYPEDVPTLGQIVRDVCYCNAEKFFLG